MALHPLSLQQKRVYFSGILQLLLTILFIGAFGPFALGQLVASFTPDKPGACAPALFRFTNTTTGASPNATYRWDLGNGNTSSLRDPSATYDEEKDHLVTLTVIDGDRSSTISRTITVYKRPQVDFSVANAKFCLPEQAVFSSNSTPGSGTIQSLTWDFGDGSTQTVHGSQQVTHNYSLPVLATVTLSVANSHGCYSTLQKRDLVRVLPEVKPSFEPDKLFVCSRNDKVAFTNESTGPGNLSYLWNFGDGKTSTLAEPEHIFNQAGAYQVTLEVISDEGCRRTSESVTINVDNFVTNFSHPPLMCAENYHELTNTSSPRPTQTIWTIDDQTEIIRFNGGSVVWYFPEGGTLPITMVNHFGTCVQAITKNIQIAPRPPVASILSELAGKCGAPDTIRLRDTSSAAISWRWTENFNSNVVSTQRSFNFFARDNRTYYFWLSITNAEGCTREMSHYVQVRPPGATISIVQSDANGFNRSCGPFTATFAATGTDSITQYNWTFSNGGSSTLPEPEHRFTTPGSHTVTLNYTLANGCKGATSYSVTVFAMPKADFTYDTGPEICGPNPARALFSGTGPTSGMLWNFDHDKFPFGYTSAGQMSYQEEGSYSVGLIAVNGTCRDTIVKKDFFKVLPPFPRITGVLNTCDGTRGKVTFRHATVKGISGTWNFGDGNSVPFDPSKDEISHTYTRTGTFTVTLTVTNGTCTISDSRVVYVLLKQAPTLTIDRAEACANEQFGIAITKVETNPYPNSSWDRYYFSKMEYGDGTEFIGSYSKPWNFQWIAHVSGTAVSHDNRTNNIRIIFTSAHFNCQDTTNYVPLTFKGARAGFEVVSDQRCWQQPVLFRDTSKTFGSSAIVSRRWNFGDGQTLTTTAGGPVEHRYQNPGTYRVSLEITDAAGCRVSTNSETMVKVSGPKVSFGMSGSQVPLNETVYFYNYTNTGNDGGNTKYHWSFGDGNTSTEYYGVNTYPVAGTYTVQLIAENTQTGCRDTATQTLVVRPFNTAFRMQQQFIHQGGCPPVMVYFTNTSYGGIRYEWDFGDGTGAESYYASKIYEKPGKYIVSLHVIGYNGLEGTYIDSVIISEPTATFVADPLFGCTSQGIRFEARADSQYQYTWDLGDGTTLPASGALGFHHYRTPGVYQPRVLVTDNKGCTKAVNTPDKIVIDSIALSIGNIPSAVCDSVTLDLRPVVNSVGNMVDPASYQYQWSITHNGSTTSFKDRDLTYQFNKAGKYLLAFNARSPFGCDKTIYDSITVVQGVKAIITAPTDVCIATPVTISGSTGQPASGITWRWDLGAGRSSNVQNPLQQTYNAAGAINLQLIAGIGNCFDTAYHLLTVHANPTLAITQRQPVSCLGTGVQLAVSGAATYLWTPAAGLDRPDISNPMANPTQDTWYQLTGTSPHGCTSKDSVRVTVAKPFTIQVSPLVATICQGAPVQLLASGTHAYQWIGNTSGLSNTSIHNPVARPQVTTGYTVVGRDQYNCFYDTANVNITVNPLPTVDAGPDIETSAGTEIQFSPTVSPNVVRYTWSPATFLSCTGCAQPTARPMYPVTYVLKVMDDKGCEASDTVRIALQCGESFYIPNAFTPNGDGLNDRFYVLGGGATIKHIRIFDRWGKLVYQKNNIQVNDGSQGWDGTVAGQPQPAGSYVYLAVLECFDGSTYEYKGSVTLIR
ncbi:MAG TPA: PKD domain-containing protein [Phnomibacter sp.]|nr:PKD domain-containing protein [Phnomibacter sp.]